MKILIKHQTAFFEKVVLFNMVEEKMDYKGILTRPVKYIIRYLKSFCIYAVQVSGESLPTGLSGRP